MQLAIVVLATLTLVGCETQTPAAACEGPRDAYPAGPYGKRDGKVIEDLSFAAVDDSTFSLSSVLADEGAKLLLVTTAAGWCTACIEEQAVLEQLHDDHYADGLRIMLAYFEDQDFNPAALADAQAWATRFGLTFPVVVDPDFVLGSYYDRTLTPVNMFIQVPCMKIHGSKTGFDPGWINATLGSLL